MNALHNVIVWDRNSFRRKRFVFGVSDLDITVVAFKKNVPEQSRQISTILNKHKKQFPFLGETNFYLNELIVPYAPFLNYYELLRDPELASRIGHVQYENDNVEKVVFLLRMIYADRLKLGKLTFLRQRKWKGHFADLGFIVPKNITVENILKNLLGIMKLDVALEEKFVKAIHFVLTTELDEQNIYHIELPDLWKFLFPHKHIWFDFDREENFQLIKGTFLEKVCLRQLDWEVWGLMSQLPFLPSIDENLIEHLKRQARASHALNPAGEMTLKVDQLVQVAEKFKNY